MTGLPNRLNLVTIQIKQLKKGSSDTYVDPDFAEPAGPIGYTATVTLEGQVNLMSQDFKNLFRSITGDTNQSRGHLVFRNPVTDINGTAVTLQKGDIITSIAGESVEFYIYEIRPESPLNGGFLLKYCEFGENPLTRESR